MIIISQDKSAIFNFNNIDWIDAVPKKEIQSDYNGEHFVITTNLKLNGEIFLFKLGEYEKEERAKRILENITNAYGLNMYMYQMPKK